MNKKVRELRQQLAKLKKEAADFLEQKKLDDADAIITQCRNIQREIESLEALDDMDATMPADVVEAQREAEKKDIDVRAMFVDCVRGGCVPTKEMRDIFMKEGNGASGAGLIVPKDVLTLINQFKSELTSLDALVNLEPVTTMSGSRVYEKRAKLTPFAKLNEGDKIGATDHPDFINVNYLIAKYAGIMDLTNEIIADTDNNLLNYISGWLANKDVVTRNTQILTVLKGFDKTPIAKLDDIKKVYNVSLDPAFEPFITIITNQDGFNYLDQQKDNDGRYMMQTDPTNPTAKIFGGYPVVKLSNNVLPTDTKKAPILIGDLKSAVTVYDRELFSLKTSDVAGDAFDNDLTRVRGITRFDVQKVDTDAVVFGEVTIA